MKLLENDVMEEMLEEYYASENQAFLLILSMRMERDVTIRKSWILF